MPSGISNKTNYDKAGLYRRGTPVYVHGIPGWWRYSHPGSPGRHWVDAASDSAKRYVIGSNHGMLNVETKAITRKT